MNKRILGPAAALALLIATSAGAQGTKYHQGHYLQLAGDDLSAHLKQIAEIGNERHIKGVVVRIWWYDLEKWSGGYDFSRINTYLSKVKQQPTRKQLIIRVMDRDFNTKSAWDIVPNYLRNGWQYNGGIVRTRTGYAARLWEAPVMSRRIALFQAIGRRYDGDRHFEGLMTEESTLGFSQSEPLPSGYTHAALAQQYIRFMRQVKPTMPRSQLFMNANWIGPTSLMQDIVRTMLETGTAYANSNTIPGKKTLGQRVVLGEESGPNYRWMLAIANAVEDGELGGKVGSFLPWQIGSWGYNELHSNYMFWTRNTWTGTSAQRWIWGIQSYLRSKPPIRTACPTVYNSCDRW